MISGELCGAMSPPKNTDGFSSFPYRELLFSTNRRRFFNGLALEMMGLKSALGGRPVFSLADLGKANTGNLASLVPVIRQDMDYLDDPAEVRCHLRSENRTVTLFKRTAPALSAFNFMNGSTSLAEIAQQLSAEYGWIEHDSFAFVRGLFLTLVEAGICFPKYPLKSVESP